MVDRSNPTYRSIAERYDEYVEIVASKPELQQKKEKQKALPPQRPYTPPEENDMGRTVFAGIGFVIAALILVLAAWAFSISAEWASLNRSGAAVGFLVMGICLVISGGGGMIAVWNHNFRVLKRAEARER